MKKQKLNTNTAKPINRSEEPHCSTKYKFIQQLAKKPVRNREKPVKKVRLMKVVENVEEEEEFEEDDEEEEELEDEEDQDEEVFCYILLYLFVKIIYF